MIGKHIKNRLISFSPIFIGIIIILAAGGVKIFGWGQKVEEKMITEAKLTEAINISELYTAQFTYNGIAEIYKDDSSEKVKCYVRYNSKVKAGIDVSQVSWVIDEEKKTVKPVLPEIKISASVVDEDTLSFIPANTKTEIKTVLIACKEDADREAKESKELLESAKDNLKSIIEALTYPLVVSCGYEVIWE